MVKRLITVRVSAVAAAAAFVVGGLYFGGVILGGDSIGRLLGGCVWFAIGAIWLWQHTLARRRLGSGETEDGGLRGPARPGDGE